MTTNEEAARAAFERYQVSSGLISLSDNEERDYRIWNAALAYAAAKQPMPDDLVERVAASIKKEAATPKRGNIGNAEYYEDIAKAALAEIHPKLTQGREITDGLDRIRNLAEKAFNEPHKGQRNTTIMGECIRLLKYIRDIPHQQGTGLPENHIVESTNMVTGLFTLFCEDCESSNCKHVQRAISAQEVSNRLQAAMNKGESK